MERHNGIEPDPEGAFVYYADAQAAVEVLNQQVIDLANQADAAEQQRNVAIAKLEAARVSVEALQQERDQWKEAFERSCDDTAHLRTAFDAEREKVKALDAMYRQQLEGRDKRIENLAGSAKIWMEKLTQIQALVRAAGERWRAQTNVKEGISFRMAMKALEATLDATTPATHEQAKATVFNEWDGALRKMADVEPKGGDGE